MLVALVVQAALFAVSLIAIRHLVALQERRDRAHTEQVAELLTRIQHPERIPIPTVHWERRPERERDELHRVGRIEVG
jgi:hypothetical protein